MNRINKDYLFLMALAFKIHELNLARELLDREGEKIAKLTEKLYAVERSTESEHVEGN